MAVAQGFAAHSDVKLDVEGDVTEVGTFAPTVADLLKQQGVEVSASDLLAPSADTQLTNGSEVVVRYAKDIMVTDGTQDRVFTTTALTADEALSDIAERTDGMSILVGRSTNRVAPVMNLEITPGQDVRVQADGKTTTVTADAQDIGDVLTKAGIHTANNDRVTLTTGEDGTPTVVVTRMWTERRTSTEDVAFQEQRQEDASLYKGTEKVAQEGAPGQLEIVTDVDLVDGAVVAQREVSRTQTVAPVDKVIAVGTKPKPTPTPTPARTKASTSTGSGAAASGGSSAPAPAGGSGSGLNWAALARCESGGNPGAVSASGKYYGLYQFSVSTWRSVGGSGVPSEASAAEQTERAIALYNRSGAGQWPHCGPRLFS